ncbi:hypothetical protein [Aeoliella mucimassa]|uniref:Uncharacterized protein n=1 Tax=Aeoliella mucimassa TaxID=2527972 RepID=A0A518ANP3_9BACT|nr:hypothetical protein [Aeoliella mucimassa]QDU56344.1 hypothetical protein Pan181_25530 [Aeoliella mucimassa]
MSRASRRDNSTDSSLFPFLAVLLCTMGVLVVLLSVMASVQLDQAKERVAGEEAEAQHVAEQFESEEQIALRAKLEKLKSRADEVDEFRTKTKELLSDKQKQLAQVEENVRRRQEELGLLRRQIEEMQALDSGATDNLEEARFELQRQRELIAQTEREIEQLKQGVKNSEKNFAIVPYNGDSGVRRQPIYIECRRDRVIFQPEGIELTAEDFNSEFVSGSPLPSAIRAAQSYYQKNGLASDVLPYPLVIVRPDATRAMFVVLTLLEELDQEFGYEIVEQDWEVDFSAADPGLTDEIGAAVDLARKRMARRREGAPRNYGEGAVASLAPSESIIDRIQQGRLVGQGIIGAGGQSPVGGAPQSSGINPNLLAQAIEQGGTPNSSTPGGTGGTGGSWSPFNAQSGAQAANAPQAAYRTLGQGSPASAPMGAAKAAMEGSSATASGGDQNQAMEAAMAAAMADAATNNKSGAAESNGQSQAGSNGASGSNAEGSAAGNSSIAGGSAADGSESAYVPNSRQQGSSGSGVAVTRTIRMQVSARQLVVISSKLSPGATDRTIPLDANPRLAATSIAKAISDEVADWGMAGQGTYWKPVLKMTVTPDGSQMAASLARALRQGGIEVQIAATNQSTSIR